jgi:hypothetical protein
MSINAIKDALKAFAEVLNVASIFPAGLLVLVNAYLVLPALFPAIQIDSAAGITLVISASLMISYTLYAFTYPLTRLFEGYPLRSIDLFQGWHRKHKNRWLDLNLKLEQLRETVRGVRIYLHRQDLSTAERRKWERVLQALVRMQVNLESEYDAQYPSTLDQVLPTSLGNILAAFEDYPRTRYGMESIDLWTRLLPILRDTKYIDFVAQEKTAFDFLRNTSVVMIVIGLELFYLALFMGSVGAALLICAATLLVHIVLYNGMLHAAGDWGAAFRAAFDLFRYDLHRVLHLEPTETFEEERRQWENYSRFLSYRRKKPEYEEFVAQTEYYRQNPPSK